MIPNCAIPFAGIAQHHSIDDNCGARGEVPDPPVEPNDPAHALQDVAKNNFCATGTPALVTFTTFKKLQQKLDQKAPVAKFFRTNYSSGDNWTPQGTTPSTHRTSVSPF